MASQVNDKYICGVCTSVLKEPVSLECGHIFCRNCVEQCERAGHHSCPTCRESVDIRCLVDEWTLELEIKRQLVKCSTCQQEIKLITLNDHEQQCGVQQPSVSAGLRQGHAERLVPNRHTFNCPFCGEKNLSQEGLLKHVHEEHNNESNVKVVCPICAVMPWGDPNQKSGNFIQHLNLRHKFEYERFVDYSKDDDEQLRTAIENSKAQF